MTTPAKLYVQGIKRKLQNYYAAWLPNEQLKLGDIGILEGDFFRRVTSLADIQISFQERPDPNPSPIHYVSESGAGMFLKATGEVNVKIPSVPKGKAGVAFEFTQQGAFVVKAAETYEPTVENIAELEDAIIQAWKDGRWKWGWAAIVKIVQAPTASILISNSSKAKLEFSVEGTIPGGGLPDIGSTNISFGLSSQEGDVLHLMGAKHISPFFQLARLYTKGIFGHDVGIRYALPPRNRDIYTNLSLLDVAPREILRDDPEVIRSLYLDLVVG